MPTGYPDYWEKAAPGLPEPSVEQLEWGTDGSDSIAGGATVALIDVTALAGYVNYIAGGVVCSDFPMIQRYREWLDLGVSHWQYFDTRALLPYNPSALREIVAGERYRLWVNNLDTVAHTFTVLVWGFRVALVTGTTMPTGLGLGIAGSGG